MPPVAPGDGEDCATGSPPGLSSIFSSGPASAPPLPARRPNHALIEKLQAKIHDIERAGGILSAPRGTEADGRQPWTLGANAIDRQLGAGGLDVLGLHEIKPSRGGRDAGAALGFALRLLLRLRASLAHSREARRRILWCTTDRSAHELGRPHAPGLAGLGLEPAHLMVVEARRASEALWAIEEGLKSQSLLLVLGVLDDIPDVAARRLSLAAEAGRTPALLLTHPHRAPAIATASRWRISAQPGAPHPFDDRAPGSTRLALALERCRNRPLEILSRSHVVEWSDATHRFRVVAELADRAAPPSSPARRATG